MYQVLCYTVSLILLLTLWRRYCNICREEENCKKVRRFGNKMRNFKYIVCLPPKPVSLQLSHSQHEEMNRMISGVSSGRISCFKTWSQESAFSVINLVGPAEQLFPVNPVTPWHREFNFGTATGPQVYSWCFTWNWRISKELKSTSVIDGTLPMTPEPWRI